MILQLKNKAGALTPPPSLLPGEVAFHVAPGAIRMWVGDSAGAPFEFGTDADGFVRKTGDTMTGALSLPSANPTAANHATRKGYVDSQVGGRLTQAQGDARYVQLAGGTMTGLLTLSGVPTAVGHAATKGYIDGLLTAYSTTAQADALYVNVAGDTMTGALSLPSANPTAANHATRKGYVDSQVGGRLTQAQGDARYSLLDHTHTEAQVTDLNRVRYRGTWSADAYAVNDLVLRGGHMYLATAATSAVPPGAGWVQLNQGGANASYGDAPPANPNPGDLWYRTAGTVGLYVRYADADSQQWVAGWA